MKRKILILLIIIVYAIDITLVAFWLHDNYNQKDNRNWGVMPNQQIQLFNLEFETYSGTQKGTTVKTFLSTVAANNVTHGDEGLAIKVTYEGVTSDNLNDLNNMRANIFATRKYTINLKYDNTGRVNEAIITEEPKEKENGK